MNSTTLSLATNTPQIIKVPTDATSIAALSIEAGDDATILVEGSVDGSTFSPLIIKAIAGAVPRAVGAFDLYADTRSLVYAICAGLVSIQVTNQTVSVTPTGTATFSSASLPLEVADLASASLASSPPLHSWAVYGVSGGEEFLLDFIGSDGAVIAQETVTYSGDPSSLLFMYNFSGGEFPDGTVAIRGRMTAGTIAKLNLAGESVEGLGGLIAWNAALGLGALTGPDTDDAAWTVVPFQEFTLTLDATGNLVFREKSWGTIAALGTAAGSFAYELLDANGHQLAEGVVSTGITTAKSLASHIRANPSLTDDIALAVNAVRLRVLAGTLYINGAGNPDPTATGSNGILGTAPSANSPIAITVGGLFEWSE